MMVVSVVGLLGLVSVRMQFGYPDEAFHFVCQGLHSYWQGSYTFQIAPCFLRLIADSV
jgi:hypothetical protein